MILNVICATPTFALEVQIARQAGANRDAPVRNAEEGFGLTRNT